jgi:tetrahydromethanopterin S-methyltransferase subunit D
MPINPDAVGTKSEPARRKWNSKDALIYALGVGAGAADPLDELEFTTENTSGKEQRVLPTMAVVLGPLGGGFGAIGSFNPAMLVHGEEGITLHREIPVEGELESVSEITAIYDKGKGAVVVSESKAVLADTG